MSKRPVRVLVTDAHSTSALAVARSLGGRGMRVTVAGEAGRFNLAGYSRFVERSLVWPRAEDDPNGYLDCLEAELARSSYDLLVPTTDTTVTLVRHRRDRLDRRVRVALPSNEVLQGAQDKALTMQLAREAGVAIPRTWTFSSLGDVERLAPEIPYPCVVKPRHSCRWDGSGPLVRDTVRYVESAAALLQAFRSGRERPEFVLVQELVTGAGVGVFAVTKAGVPLATFAHRRMREANPTGGRASLAQSIAADERLMSPALRLLAALRWTGVAMIEFKDPGPPAPPFLMEINGRFWGSLPLAIAAGVDFPLLLAQLMLDEPMAPQRPYAVGVRARHLKGDISYLIAALKGRPRHWRGAFPSRLGAIAAVLPWPGRWSSYNFRMSDPVPALREAGNFVSTELRRLTASRPAAARPAAGTHAR